MHTEANTLAFFTLNKLATHMSAEESISFEWISRQPDWEKKLVIFMLFARATDLDAALWWQIRLQQCSTNRSPLVDMRKRFENASLHKYINSMHNERSINNNYTLQLTEHQVRIRNLHSTFIQQKCSVLRGNRTGKAYSTITTFRCIVITWTVKIFLLVSRNGVKINAT